VPLVLSLGILERGLHAVRAAAEGRRHALPAARALRGTRGAAAHDRGAGAALRDAARAATAKIVESLP
jgi:hypothetical protein